jgi:asparagine synthase (glutamine-hydrolysing)
LDCQAGALSVRRYWTLPEAEPIRYACAEDYVERFSEIFDTAVGDRLRTNAAGLLLSGGLDSPTVAISARRVLGWRSAPADLRACTLVYSSLIRSDEGRYARLAAEALRIPIEFLTVDQDGLLNDQVDRPNYHPPEPVHLPLGAGNANPFENLSSHSRVALTGFGGDPALASLLSRHFRSLMEQRQFGRMLADVAAYLGAEGRFSRLYLRTRWKRWFGSKTAPSAYPTWLHEDLESQLHLRERWEDLSRPLATNRSARPEAYAEFTQAQWSNACELLDAGAMGVPIEVSHPFFDLRVVNFLIALPALPCCSDKEILRISARGILPPAVRLRRKSPLASDPVMALLQKPESAWMDQFKPGPTLNRYVRRERVPPVCGEKQSWAAWVNLRPLSLNSWLERCEGAVPRALGRCHERAVTSTG